MPERPISPDGQIADRVEATRTVRGQVGADIVRIIHKQRVNFFGQNSSFEESRKIANKVRSEAAVFKMNA